MNTRVKDVIAKLYRPPTHGRRVFALSRDDAEKIPLITGVAAISITAPEKAPAQLPAYEYLLRLSFADVDFLGELSARAAEKLPDAMTRQDAEAILEFVQALPSSIHSLVVHCEGGFSRSAGVVMALKELYGYEVEEERLAQANQSIMTIRLDIAGGKDRNRKSRRNKGGSKTWALKPHRAHPGIQKLRPAPPPPPNACNHASLIPLELFPRGKHCITRAVFHSLSMRV
ncbi:putative protein tyrosine phosphatase [Herbaspirillum frisingense]|uniref:Tyrosine specific protein phosphatases domain-containing protein n=1 Tax=Herbaspirillum frisingense TaxID=92645 RepID=A0ABU1PEI6_9BURK|nr:putative protein tyrosine phosphatase [Herbaspirillum frisingense]